MAVLYEARHVHLDVPVVVKRIGESLVPTADIRARFRNEAIAASRVRHPGVVSIRDYGLDEDGTPYLVMERLEGKSLASVLATEGPLPVRYVVDLALLTLSGLSAVHASGIVHRDLKPQNIFVRRTASDLPDPVIIDFGVAKLDDSAVVERDVASVTESGVSLGTAMYMAPEQILDAKSVGPEADQYSLGVTMYECLAGRPPFAGASAYEMMHAALNARVFRPSELRSGVPRPVEDVVLRAMEREPTARFASAHAMGEALVPFASDAAAVVWRAEIARTRGVASGTAAGDTAASSSPRMRAPPARRTFTRGPLIAALAIGGIGASIGGAALLARDSRSPSVSAAPPPPHVPEAPQQAASSPATEPLSAPPIQPAATASASGVAAPAAPDLKHATVPVPLPAPAPVRQSKPRVEVGANRAPIVE
jgi:serine/threonine-protein kinase